LNLKRSRNLDMLVTLVILLTIKREVINKRNNLK
jgi:hypothetical protein